MTNRLYLDIHLLQTLPPSNVNRDDTGSPKTARYGGALRSRVSSQAWKKAIRDMFKEENYLDHLAYRSRELPEKIKENIIKIKTDNNEDIDEEKIKKDIDKALNNIGLKTDKGKLKTLFFISQNQIDNLSQKIYEKANKTELRAALEESVSPEIALFGRMVADDKNLTVEAASQVAHAISTNSIEREFDYFVAVDDFTKSSGAGMIGSIEYNSSTLYRYANINVLELLKTLNNVEETEETIKAFINTFIKSMPSGKANTFANHSIPDLVFVSLRGDRPINYIQAFEEPIKSNNGFVEESIKRLDNEISKANKILDDPLYNTSIILDDIRTKNFGKNEDKLQNLITNVMEKIEESLSPTVLKDTI